MTTTASLPATMLQMVSLASADGTLALSLERVPVPEPAEDEILVRVLATPINPSDIGMLFGPADLDSVRATGTSANPKASFTVPPKALPALATRLGKPLPVGNEGAGVVVQAGASAAAQALLGRTVAVIGGAMYAQYRAAKPAQCIVMPPGTDPVHAASSFVNPLTSLGMVETMRAEGHTALVHTAAASNLGQMLNRICLKDGIGLVNIVRRQDQEDLLRQQGAVHVCNSSAPDFAARLVEALKATGATIAFDATGGGRLASQILSAMETAITSTSKEFNRYGSTTHKQVYLYGGLDRSPTEIVRNFGMAWGVGGWLLFPFLHRIGKEAADRLRARVAAELTTTFASHYTRTVSLAEAVTPEAIRAYGKAATGSKFLIDPTRDA